MKAKYVEMEGKALRVTLGEAPADPGKISITIEAKMPRFIVDREGLNELLEMIGDDLSDMKYGDGSYTIRGAFDKEEVQDVES